MARSGILPGTSASQRDYPVRSPSELRSALNTIAASTSRVAATAERRGSSTITITRSFVTERKIVIPAACIGVTIRSAGKNPIIARGVIDTLFEILARDVTIEKVRCKSPSTANMFTSFVTMGSATDAPDAVSPSLIDNVVEADRVYVEPAGATSTDALLRGNRQTEVNAAHAASIEIHTARARVGDGNILTDGGGDTITLGAGAGDCTVVGNDVGGGDITSTASNGGNTVGINTRVGTLTLHADDIEVGNPGAADTDWVTVTKAATDTIISDATCNDDSELFFPMAANTTYRIRGLFYIASTAVANFRMGFSGPAAPTLVHIGVKPQNAPSNIFTAYGDGAEIVFGSPDEVFAFGATIQNGANAGDMRVRWAQGTSTAVNTSMLKGSHLEYAVVP